MNIKKPETFEDLLNLQKIFDEEVLKPRKNGFIPRKRTIQDIIYALDDEIQEWLKELPKEFNFKIWKEKEYNREKELEELTDILFFILQLANHLKSLNIFYISAFNLFKNQYNIDFNDRQVRNNLIIDLKKSLYGIDERDISSIMFDYVCVCTARNFTEQDILNKYWEKWQRNMNERINGDWTLKK